MRTTAVAHLGLAALTISPISTAFHLVPTAHVGRTAGALASSQQRVLATARPVGNTVGFSAGRGNVLAASTSDDSSSNTLDVDAVGKYALATGVEMTAFAALFKGLDLALASAHVDPSSVPFAAVGFLFYFFSLKSRVFNPLNNQRPDRSKAIEGEGSAGFQDRVMPSWTPPGFIFPIMWLLIIGPIRAYSSALVFSATGTFFCPAILSLMLHLTIGDVWNTVNNTEKRYGASVIGVLGVVASAVFAATNYFAVAPFAGKILGATCLWLVTASALIADTWRLNGKEPLYPVVGETKTEFAWFASE